jgi:hypothetical protein
MTWILLIPERRPSPTPTPTSRQQPRRRRARLKVGVVVAIVALLVPIAWKGFELGASDAPDPQELLRGVQMVLPDDSIEASRQATDVRAVASLVESEIAGVEQASYSVPSAHLLLVVIRSENEHYRPQAGGGKGLQIVGHPQPVRLGPDQRYLAAKLSGHIEAARDQIVSTLLYAIPLGANVITVACVVTYGGTVNAFGKCEAAVDTIDASSLGSPAQAGGIRRFQGDLGYSLAGYVSHTRALRRRLKLQTSARSAAWAASRLGQLASVDAQRLYSLSGDPMTFQARARLRRALWSVSDAYQALARALQARQPTAIDFAESEVRDTDRAFSTDAALAASPLTGWPELERGRS